MKKSILGIALLALMASGVAQADTASTVHPDAQYRFNLACTFTPSNLSADARILLDIRDIQDEASSTQPQWFGDLLAVSYKTDLISASDAVLYRITGDDHYHWRIDNSDATISIFLQDRPFDGTTHSVPARIKIQNRPGVDGLCNIVATHVE
jgi:hypothetical protein